MAFALHRPENEEEAVALAYRLGPDGRYLAGGTDLLVQVNRRRASPGHLVALDRITGLAGITAANGEISVGALTTMKAIERAPAFATPALTALAEAARVVGGHQIRNVATLGGNIVNASPAADLLPVLLALDAELDLVGASGPRRVPLAHFLRGPGETERRPEELLRRIAFAKRRGKAATAFLKAGRRRAMEISIVCVAAYLALDEKGRCRDARIALGAVAPTAMRAAAAEKLLRGALPDAEAFHAAGEAAAAASAPIGDVRASAEYRRRLVSVLSARALRRCLDRLRAP